MFKTFNIALYFFLAISTYLNSTEHNEDYQSLKEQLVGLDFPMMDISRMGETGYVGEYLSLINKIAAQKALVRKQLAEFYSPRGTVSVLNISSLTPECLQGIYNNHSVTNVVKEKIVGSYNEGKDIYFLKNEQDKNIFVVKEINKNPSYELIAEIDEETAVQALSASLLARPEFRAPELMQITMAKDIIHEETGRVFIVLEAAGGRSLHSILQEIEQNVAEESLKKILYLVGYKKALLDIEYTHFYLGVEKHNISLDDIRSVCHGDFHSENIYIDEENVYTIDNTGMVFSAHDPKTAHYIITRDFKNLVDKIKVDSKFSAYEQLCLNSLCEGYLAALPNTTDSAEIIEQAFIDFAY